METVSIMFSPAINALPFAILLKMQMLGWLSQTYNCTQFTESNFNPNVRIFLDSEGETACGGLAYSEYFGCFYSDNRIYLNEGLFGKGEIWKDWHWAWLYRRAVLEHEFEHYFVRTMAHTGKEKEEYKKIYC